MESHPIRKRKPTHEETKARRAKPREADARPRRDTDLDRDVNYRQNRDQITVECTHPIFVEYALNFGSDPRELEYTANYFSGVSEISIKKGDAQWAPP